MYLSWNSSDTAMNMLHASQLLASNRSPGRMAVRDRTAASQSFLYAWPGIQAVHTPPLI